MNPHRLAAGGIVILVALLLGSTPSAQALQPVPASRAYEIPLPAFDVEAASLTERGTQAAAALATRYGGRWRVHAWNPRTEAPRWIHGTGPKVADAIRDAADLERLARQVIARNADILRADESQLRLTAAPHALGKWAAHFQQTWHGLDVWGAVVRVLFTDDGRLVLIGSDYSPDIDLDPAPGLSEGQAVEIARSDLPFEPSTDRIEGEATLLVLPYPLSETEVAHHLVWRVRVRTADPLGIWATYVDAHTGRVLWRTNVIDFAYLGTTDTRVQRFSYCDGATQMTIPYLDVAVSGLGTVTSDVDGNWSIDGAGGPRTVTSSLSGPYVAIHNAGGAEAFFSGTAQENVPLTVRFDDTNAQRDERDVFSAVNDIHDFFELFDPGFGYTNQPIQANVSMNGTCGAFWDGDINFFREGNGCANTGEIQQVVHHEYGHGVQDFILGWQGDQGLGEGNADVLGNLITQDHVIARGLFLNDCVNGIRDSQNDLQYPGDVIGQPSHDAGRVIAGFHWDAMVLLQQLYGQAAGTIAAAERWHFGRVLVHPTTQPDQVLATFVADDDNGNLEDGTPNYASFCEAALNHGFSCPERDPAGIGASMDAPAGALRLEARPNPFRGDLSIELSLAKRGDARLTILDAAGRRVREILEAGLAPGRRTLRWDGRDEKGRLVRSGAYFLRVAADEGTATRCVVRVR